MTRYILWDNDGVLVDTEYWYFKSTQRALEELGIKLSKTTYLTYMSQGKSCWDIVRKSGVGSIQLENKRQDRDTYYQEYLCTENIEIPGVVEVVKNLSKTHKMAIVTTSRRDDFDLIHKSRSIVPFMDFVITREDYTNSKPDPEPYLYGLNEFGASASETIVIEDSQRGLQSAISAGIECAIVHNEFTKTHDFTGAKYLVQRLEELPGLLRA